MLQRRCDCSSNLRTVTYRQQPVAPTASHCPPPTWEAALHDAGVGKRLAGGLGARTSSIGALQPLVDLALRTLARRLLDDLTDGRAEWMGTAMR